MTYLKYRGRPNSVEFNGFRLNSRGFKYAEFVKKKPPKRFRIVCLGDSQTYGAVPYPESYMTMVELKLRSVCPRCEMLNLGVPSAGPVDYLSVFLNEGLGLHPDMVLLHFNIYDDFKNGGKRFKLYSCSAAASFIIHVIDGICEPEGRIFGTGAYREVFPLRRYESYVQLVNEAHGGIFQKNSNSFSRDFRSSISFVEKIKKVCDMKKIPLVIVVIPADMQYYPSLAKKVMIIRHRTDEEYDLRQPNVLLAREFERCRIPYLDLLDIFLQRSAGDRMNLTQGNDMHWNRHGSRVAAEAVSPWLIRQVGSCAELRD